jgi:hypothetical protein
VLAHARGESAKQKVRAVVFVGDAMEEKLDDLCAVAGELGLLGVPTFLFQEGDDPVASNAFREIARLTNGAYCRLSSPSCCVRWRPMLPAAMPRSKRRRAPPRARDCSRN